MPESYYTVGFGVLGWILLFFVLWLTTRTEKDDDASNLRADMDLATRNGYPPPGDCAKDVCKEYREDGPTPCKWPYCTCTKGL